MYNITISCSSYKKGYFKFQRKYTLDSLEKLSASAIACKVSNLCVVNGITQASLRVSISDNLAGYRSLIVGKKIAVSYESILATLNKVVSEYISLS